jgi:hypothetical protein
LALFFFGSDRAQAVTTYTREHFLDRTVLHDTSFFEHHDPPHMGGGFFHLMGNQEDGMSPVVQGEDVSKQTLYSRVVEV